MEFDSLYSFNGTKIVEAVDGVNQDFQVLTSTKISISKLLDIVNEMHSDVLPKTVADHYGNKRRETKLGESVKYSITDNQGRKLSKGQQSFFKDSKMRDENGSLKVMLISPVLFRGL